MNRVLALVTALLLAMLSAGPAAAGTAEKPEITDECGAQIRTTDNSTTVVPGHVDICAGWFETTDGGLKVTLQTSGPTSPEPGFWAVWWNNGDCAYEVAVDDTTGAVAPQSFTVGCGDAPPFECPVPGVGVGCDQGDYWRTVPLPDDSVVREGNTLQVSVDFTGELAEFAGAHAPGQVLRAPRVWSTTAAGPVYAYTFGCAVGDFGTYCFNAGGDHTVDGRDYTVGT